MGRCKRWPVLQPAPEAQPGWDFQAEEDALAMARTPATVVLPRGTFIDTPTPQDVVRATAKYGQLLFSESCAIDTVERVGGAWRIKFGDLVLRYTGVKAKAGTQVEFESAWARVCAHRLAQLGYPGCTPGDAAARFVTAVRTATPSPSLPQLRLYGAPLAFTDGGDCVQWMYDRFDTVRTLPYSHYNVAAVVHPDPASLVADLVGALPTPVLVVMRGVDQAAPGGPGAARQPEGRQAADMVLNEEALTAADGKAVRRAMKAARAVYMHGALYHAVMSGASQAVQECKFAQARARRARRIATTLHDVAWGAVLAVQTTHNDLQELPPRGAFQCIAMTPAMWEHLLDTNCGMYAFKTTPHDSVKPRAALAHVTLQFPDE